MKQKRLNMEQIVAVLKQAEAGVSLVELVRRAGYDPAFPDTGSSVLLLDDRRSKQHP